MAAFSEHAVSKTIPHSLENGALFEKCPMTTMKAVVAEVKGLMARLNTKLPAIGIMDAGR